MTLITAAYTYAAISAASCLVVILIGLRNAWRRRGQIDEGDDDTIGFRVEEEK